MDYAQEQDEEREVLLSIYEEDDRFKEVDTTTFQYKFGDDSHLKSFVLEIKWTKDYPENAPDVNLSAFYNKHINDQVKRFIVSKLLEQCELNLGCAMTYTLLDWTNEHFNELTEGQSEVPQQTEAANISREDPQQVCDVKKEKKERLTKQQKRKLGNRLNTKGELERGWNWVDVVRHLSKTAPT
ncbi:hypothetical protein QZH41_008358 [Actinostola sp. cb2023]|nr:hypothetical protein QZH41_008358 [Actinostola sp. cb2023]